ncbi:hypothetical protein M427DRAFT_130409 [Gonapodya prolifera JEL478]|uniref:FAD-binding domain-containing protein n=1 Tax=Gonapodya prolifera (strain JEL478) TaxID=1344416 RepID=A0A139AY91_GONPJ|nr:hypothetical protein M427DRAFT_130409 [Gonapodya prolifera JEL478]|eukprot:KXS21664.1 hypothetical protein M427DRAFT_130409 [Gonapodya prolifera JEL478]
MVKPPNQEDSDFDWAPYQDLPKEANHMADMVASWDAPKSVVNAVRYSKRITSVWLSDVPDMKTLHQGRIIFIGDSGHGVPSSQGQGLSQVRTLQNSAGGQYGGVDCSWTCHQTLEDCAVLNELINFPGFADGDHKTVFKLFDDIRLPRVHSVAARSRMIWKTTHSSSYFGMRAGRIFLRTLFGIMNFFKIEDDIFGYKCDRDIAKALEKYRKQWPRRHQQPETSCLMWGETAHFDKPGSIIYFREHLFRIHVYW